MPRYPGILQSWKVAFLYNRISMADSTGFDLDEDFVFFWRRDLFYEQVRSQTLGNLTELLSSVPLNCLLDIRFRFIS